MFVQFQSIKIHWESFYGRPYGVFWGTSPCTSAECASGCCQVQCSPMSVRSSGLIMLFKSFISLYPFCLDVLSIIESSILKSLTVIVELSVSLFSSVRTHSVAETPPHLWHSSWVCRARIRRWCRSWCNARWSLPGRWEPCGGPSLVPGLEGSGSLSLPGSCHVELLPQPLLQDDRVPRWAPRPALPLRNWSQSSSLLGHVWTNPLWRPVAWPVSLWTDVESLCVSDAAYRFIPSSHLLP